MWPFKKNIPATVPAVIPQEKKRFTTAQVEAVHGGAPIWSDWSTSKAIGEGLKASVWVYACAMKRADSVASVPLVAGKMVQGEFEPLPDTDPLQVLLEKPNSEMGMSDFLRKAVLDLDLGGNSYFGKIRGGREGAPLELWPYQVDNIQIVPGKVTLIAGYVHSQNGSNNIPADDMVHMRFVDPGNPYFGLAPLKAAGKAVDIDNSAHTWQHVSMQERGVPDGVLSLDGDNVTDQQHAQAMAEVKRHKAGPSNARGLWVLAKAKFHQTSLTPVEMDFMETRRFTREEICSVYGVPSALIAEMGSVNLANSETARRAFWIDTIEPLLTKIEGQLTRQLAVDFGPGIEIRFDTSGIPALQANLGEKLSNAEKLFALGVPFNTIAELLDLGVDDIKGGDIGYISAGQVPSSITLPPIPDAPGAPAVPGDEPPE